MRSIFVCGGIGVGKSTLVRQLLSVCNKPVFGFFTAKEPPGADGLSRVYLHDATQSRRLYLEDNCIGLVGQSFKRSRPMVFDRLGVSLLDNIPPGGIVVMDELGVLESEAPLFRNRVLEILSESYFVIGAVKPHDTPFLNRVRCHERVQVYQIDQQNRDSLTDKLKQKVLSEWNRKEDNNEGTVSSNC